MKPETRRFFAQAFAAGMLGFVTLAIVMALTNLFAGRSPFYTAALLGQSLFYGLTDPAQLTIAPGPVFAANGVHLLIFMMLGGLAAGLANFSERGPHFWYIAVIVMLFVVLHLFGLLLLVTDRVRTALSPWMLFGSGLAVLVVMTSYLVWSHPRLRSEFRDFAALDSDLADEETS